ncbi:hypothetical protein [Cardinium endosymbiont of Sogatella furcifera]|uniref:hypothetical protein n=1 Tax=Cardinium endosymbiont of Sogatella furcifera TaxID=650378 RepID=UPI000E0CE611|nr:hypothetical protein [Cardinium endosymbiont of Sogatella furcifera]
MKTYRNARVSLFIGLLSLNTLTSCVNTRQELGANNRRHNKSCSRTIWDSMVRVNRRHPVLCLTGSVVGGVILLGFFGGTLYYVLGNNTGMAHNNGTGLNTSTPFPPINGSTTVTPFSIDDTTVKFITDAIEKGEEQWGSSTTTLAPLVGEHANVITDKIVKDLNDNGWSPKSIKKWLDAGLHINATDADGCNMWNRVSKLTTGDKEKKAVLDFLDKQQIDVNKPC